MKKNKAILNQVEKYRTKRGIKVADESSLVYKVLKIIYILSFIWLLAMQLLYLLGQALFFSELSAASDAAIASVITIAVMTAFLIAGFILVLRKKHIAAAVFNAVPLVVCTLQFYRMMSESVYFDGIKSAFFWRHCIPAVLAFISCGILCFIGIRAKVLLNRDYKKIINNLYLNNKDRLSNATDEEWEAFLENYEQNDAFQPADKSSAGDE